LRGHRPKALGRRGHNRCNRLERRAADVSELLGAHKHQMSSLVWAISSAKQPSRSTARDCRMARGEPVSPLSSAQFEDRRPVPVRLVKNKALEASERSISYFFVRLVRCIEATERIDERCN